MLATVFVSSLNNYNINIINSNTITNNNMYIYIYSLGVKGLYIKKIDCSMCTVRTSNGKELQTKSVHASKHLSYCRT